MRRPSNLPSGADVAVVTLTWNVTRRCGQLELWRRVGLGQGDQATSRGLTALATSLAFLFCLNSGIARMMSKRH